MSIELKITDKTNVQFPIVIKDKNGNEIYKQYEDVFWWEKTYDNNNNVLTYKDSYGDYRIRCEYVTKEEYEAFINGIPEYTMEELTAKIGHNFKIKKN
jgi:hypothetical protein